MPARLVRAVFFYLPGGRLLAPRANSFYDCSNKGSSPGKKGGTVKSFYSFLLVANGLSIALLIGFCAVISAKAAWKGMPVAALAVSGVKAAVFLLNILLLRGRTPLILALAGIGIDIALIVLFLSIAMKAKMKAPSAVAAVTVLFSLVLMLPNGLMRTELGRYAYRFLSISKAQG
jgi:hypothetical protein